MAFSPASRLSRESLRGAEGTASPGAAGWVGWQRWAGGGGHISPASCSSHSSQTAPVPWVQELCESLLGWHRWPWGHDGEELQGGGDTQGTLLLPRALSRLLQQRRVEALRNARFAC